jgi:hypothetical protein
VASRVINIKVTATDKASGVLRNIGGGFSDLGKMAAVGGLAVAGAVAGVGAGLIKLAVDAAPMEGISRAFGGLTKDFEGGSAAMLKALQDGSMGMVTQMDLMKSFNEASQLVSLDFAQRMPDAMQYLSKVSAATGQDMGFMIDSLVKGVGRLSGPIIDNLGVQVQLSEAVERASEMFGVEADQLTKTQQQAGMMDVVIQKLAVNTEKMPDITRNASTELARFTTRIHDGRIAVGRAFLPALVSLSGLGLRLADKVFPRLVSGTESLGYAISAVLSGAPGDFPWEDILPPKMADIAYKIAGGVETLGRAISVFSKTIRHFLKWGELMGWEEFAPPSQTSEAVKNFVEQLGLLTAQIIPMVMDHLPAFQGAIEGIALVIAQAALIGTLRTITRLLLNLTNPMMWIITLAALLGAAWKDNWFDIQGKTQAAWNAIGPIFESLKGWFETAIPVAMGILGGVWETTLKPVFENIGNFINTNVVPAIDTVITWLQTNLPLAFTAASQVYYDIFAPVLIAMWGFINETVIPILKDLWSEIYEALPEAFARVETFWNDTLLPALTDLYEYIRDSVVPAIVEFFDWLNVQVPLAYEAVKTAWEETLRPVVEKLVEFITEKIIPGIGEIVGWFKEKIPEAFQGAQTAWNTTLKPMFENIVEWVGNIVEAIQEIINAVGQAVDALGNLNPLKTTEGYALTSTLERLDIPQQQHGGFWQRSGLAYIHSNEAVLPLGSPAGIDALAQALAQAIQSVGGGDFTQNNTITDGAAMEILADDNRQRRRAQLAELM